MRIGLVNTVVPPAQWAERVDGLMTRLARSFNPAVAEGKRTFYEQAAAPSLPEKYAIATDAMVEMFASESYQAAMAAFLERRKS